MLTKNQSTKDFVSECHKDGYTVDENSSSALEYTGLGLAMTGGIKDRVSNALDGAAKNTRGLQMNSDIHGLGLDFSDGLQKIEKLSRLTKFSGVLLGGAGLAISAIQFEQAKDIGGKIESGMDVLMGGIGFAGPVGAGISLYWSTIGKPLTKMHAKTITEQMEMGINPGLPANQAFK